MATSKLLTTEKFRVDAKIYFQGDHFWHKNCNLSCSAYYLILRGLFRNFDLFIFRITACEIHLSLNASVFYVFYISTITTDFGGNPHAGGMKFNIPEFIGIQFLL